MTSRPKNKSVWFETKFPSPFVVRSESCECLESMNEGNISSPRTDFNCKFFFQVCMMLLCTSPLASMQNHGQLNAKPNWQDDISTIINQACNTSPEAVNELFIESAGSGRDGIVAALLSPHPRPTAMTKNLIPNFCDPIPTLRKAFVRAVMNGHLGVVEVLFKSRYFRQSCFDTAPLLARYALYQASKPGQEKIYNLIKEHLPARWPIHSAL